MGFHPAYTGFYFDVRIFDPVTPEVFHFQAPEFPFVTGVTVNFQMNWAVATIVLTIDAPFVEGLKMLNSNMFVSSNLIEVKIGYPNGPKSPPFYGILHQGGVGLELTPNGLTGTISCNAYGKVELYETRQKAKSLEEAFRAAVIESGRFKKVGFEGGVQDAFDKFANYRVTGAIKNKDIVELAHRLTNTWSVKDPLDDERMLVFYAPSQKSAKPTRKFVMRGQFAEKDGVPTYPIMSYGPSTDAGTFIMDPPGASGVEAPRVNDAGEVEVSLAKPEDSDEKAGQDEIAKEPGTEVNVKAGEGGQEKQVDRPVDESTESTQTLVIGGPGEKGMVEAQIKNLQEHLARRLGLKSNIVTVGIPDIEGREVCELFGMGKIFNGIYTIDGVTHQCAIGDFTTTLAVQSGLVLGKQGANKETA